MPFLFDPQADPALLSHPSPLPEDLQALARQFVAGQILPMIGSAKMLIARFPHHGFGWSALGLAFGQLGPPSDAISPLQRATRLAPHDAEIHNNYAHLQEKIGRLAGSADSARRALSLRPDYAEAYLNLAVAVDKAATLGAITANRRALILKPALPQAFNNLGLLLFAQENLLEATLSYRKALALAPDFSQAWNNLANAQHRQDRPALAVASYQRALSVRPDYSEAHNNLSLSLTELRQFPQAAAHCRRALVLRPAFAKAFNGLGILSHNQGLVDAARGQQRRALAIDPGFAEAFLNLAQAEISRAQPARAWVAFAESFARDPLRSGQFAAIDLAVLAFLKDDHALSRAWLERSRPVLAPGAVNHKFGAPYWTYLDLLLSWHQTGQDPLSDAESAMMVVGESHALAAHGVTLRHRGRPWRCRSYWIPGCKQFHLGKPGANRYKHHFAAQMRQFAPGATVLLLIGEIDCRHDDGIARLLARDPWRSADSLVEQTVALYIRQVAESAARHGHHIVIAGVPTPNLPPGRLDHRQNLDHRRIIAQFNSRLAESAAAAGMDFLDLAALTAEAAGRWHLDHFHLRPEAYREAFQSFCRSPAPSR